VLTAPEDAARAACAAYDARVRRGDESRGLAPSSDGGPQERIARIVGARPRGVAALARAVGLPVGEAAAALLALEIAGRIERAGGDRYRRRER